MNDRELTNHIRTLLRGEPEGTTDLAVTDLIERAVWEDPELRTLTASERRACMDSAFFRIRKDLDILHPYLEDPQVTEIMVNGIRDVFIEREGRMERIAASFENAAELEEIIRRLAARVHREINEQNPIVDARLADGSRMNAVYKNVALDGPILTIRKFPERRLTMDRLIAWKTLTEEAAEFLRLLVEAGYNLFISGGTSSGKTTFLNILAGYIPERERVIVIEDSAELQISHLPNIVRMECKSPNAQGKGLVTMEQLIKTSLRMRPDRIIVGEVRGREVLDMIQAMNTGHDGSLSTGHGNSVEGMLLRLESMVLQAAGFPIDAIRSQIGEALDILVHLGKMGSGSRRVLEISELVGVTERGYELNRLFAYTPGKGLLPTGNGLVHRNKLLLLEERVGG